MIALRSCRQLSDDNPAGECYTSAVIKALDIAIGKKADIVNMSFGAMVHDRLIASILKKGAEHNIVFIAPVGNDKSMKVIGFPASHPAVLAVAGIDDNGKPYPNEALYHQAGISAPAVNVFTTIPDNNHNYMSGTSISSAIVTGILTLAAEKKKLINIKDLPKYNGSLCEWETKILEIPVCDN